MAESEDAKGARRGPQPLEFSLAEMVEAARWEMLEAAEVEGVEADRH